MEEKRISESRVILTQLMGVTNANTHGNVHGGIIMKLCDEAGGMAAIKHARRASVTVTVDSMTFHSPVHIGNLLTVKAEISWVGRTSMEAFVCVSAEDVLTGTVTHTNTAFFVYVALAPTFTPSQSTQTALSPCQPLPLTSFYSVGPDLSRPAVCRHHDGASLSLHRDNWNLHSLLRATRRRSAPNDRACANLPFWVV